MEYCCILWSPVTQELTQLLESVQKNFTSKISFNTQQHLDYWDRLKELKLYSLERRRERYTVIYCWKVIHNIYPNPGLTLNTALPSQHTENPNQGFAISFNDRTGLTLSHTMKDSPPLKQKSILSRCCSIYNALPSKLRMLSTEDTPSLPAFKKQLDEWLESIPDQPYIPNRQRASTTNSIVEQRHFRA